MTNLSLEQRKTETLEKIKGRFAYQADRMFAALMMVQWFAAILIALIMTPFNWAGGTKALHPHVYAALFLGGLFSSLPVYLAIVQPGRRLNRHVIAIAQMLYSALLIHLTGGRIETHFHIFGSLAFLSIYRDPKVLIVASVVTLTDHVVRGLLWPESLYGVLSASPWRAAEHGAWVLFEDLFLIYLIEGARNGIKMIADIQARLEESLHNVEATVQERTAELVAAQHNIVVSAKNSALGEMAGQIAHEINTPLGTLVLSVQSLVKKLDGTFEVVDVQNKLNVILQVTHKMSRIINSMRRFARQSGADMSTVNIQGLIEDTLVLCESRFKRFGVEFNLDNPLPNGRVLCHHNEISQVLLNLLNNAVDAVKDCEQRKITLAISAHKQTVRFAVVDSGSGVPPEHRSKLFSLQFTTKSPEQGTGLGLPISYKLIENHKGRIFYDETQSATTFAFELPAFFESSTNELAG